MSLLPSPCYNHTINIHCILATPRNHTLWRCQQTAATVPLICTSHFTTRFLSYIQQRAPQASCITKDSHCFIQTATMVEWSYCAKTHGQSCYVPSDQYHNDRASDRVATKFKSSISLWIQSTDKSVRAVMNPAKCRNSTQLSHTKAHTTLTSVRNQRTKKVCGKSEWKIVMQTPLPPEVMFHNQRRFYCPSVTYYKHFKAQW